MKAAQSCKMKNRRTIQMTKTTPNVIGQLKPKFRISPATATAMTKLTNQAIPRQSIGMWTPLECGYFRQFSEIHRNPPPHARGRC